MVGIAYPNRHVALALALGAAVSIAACGGGGGREGAAARSGVAAARIETAAPTSGRTSAKGEAQQRPVWLDTMQMVSAKAGWALLWTSNPAQPNGGALRVARTADGGKTWTEVTPAAATSALANGDAVLKAASSQRAWLVVAPYSGPLSNDTLVFGTGNGGATWSAAARVRGSQPVAIDFVGESRGWLLESMGAAMEQNPVRLYRSTDGGRRWSLVASSAASAADPPSSSGLPVYCDKDGMSFATARQGWITGYCNSLSDAVLESADGGTHWTSPSLPLSGLLCESAGCELQAPQFAGTTTFLEICVYPSAAYLLVSSNAGATWQTERLPAGAGPYPRLQWFSATDAIAVSAGAQGVIERNFYLTANGGQSWTAVRQGKRFGSGASFEFISQHTGFAWNDGLDGPVQPRLFLTTNSGRSWAVIRPVLS
jgi:photosystem II stability/assembly factor-like uncharacterized protein